MKTTVREILQRKGREIWSVHPSDTVYEAIELMDAKGVGALAVRFDDELVGIISERDYARKVILRGKSSDLTKVCDVMSTDLVCGEEEDTIEDCMTLMAHRKVRHLPVLDNGEVTGMISMSDLVHRKMEEQELVLGRMQTYAQAAGIIGVTIVLSLLLQVANG